MAGKSGIVAVLVLVIAVFAAAGCSSPAGSMGQGVPQARVYEGLAVEYVTSDYYVDDYFSTAHITAVFLVNSLNRKEPLQRGAYKIFVIEDISSPIEYEVTTDRYQLRNAGVNKAIKVRYNEKIYLTVQYPIRVLPRGESAKKGSGIVVEWEDKP